MCHLTASKQTKLVNARLYDYMAQARAVFKHYDKSGQPATSVHFNFMARGEAFANDWFVDNAEDVLQQLGQMAVRRALIPRFLISTIMPKSMHDRNLARIFPLITPEIYYSLYSTRDVFRNKWLPNAMPVSAALWLLREYQDQKRIVPKLHWCFIKDENDSGEDVAAICDAVKAYGLQANLAIVRYNPYNQNFGEEATEERIEANKKMMELMLPGARVKKITRVGMDVKASCGMFVEADYENDIHPF